MKNKFSFKSLILRNVAKPFLFLVLSICLLVGTPNFVYAKYTDNEKAIMAQAVYMSQQAFTDIAAKNYSKAKDDLNACNGFVSSLIAQNTDNKLLVELQKQIGNIAAAQQSIDAKQYDTASTLSHQVWTELDAAGKAASSRNSSSTTKPKTAAQAEAETKAAADAAKTAAEAAKANSEINSGVTVKAGQSFDTVLGKFFNPLEFETVPELILRLINIGLLLAAMLAVIVIITSGFNLVTAMGNESKITKGKRSIMWAIGGLIVCLLSFSIVAIIQKVIS